MVPNSEASTEEQQGTYIELTPGVVKKIGNILVQLRTKKNISQESVSKKMKLKAQSQVSCMENNRKTPGLLNTVRYLETVGCKLAIIVE